MSFEEDYPAAHSMDTTWFAVDKDGYIAIMESNEEGPVPICVEPQRGELMESLANSVGRKLLKDESRIELPASIGLYTYWAYFDRFPGLDESDEEAVERAEELSEQGVACPYARTELFEKNDGFKAPAEPLRYGDLSTETQKWLNPLHLKHVSFVDTDWIQPALLTQCQFWNLDRSNPQAIDEQGNLVPIPQLNIDPRNLDGSGKDKAEASPGSSGKPWWKKLFGG